MHDIVSLEAAGVPGVFVASHVFTAAATAQAEALGMPDIRRVFVDHPVQDRTDEEMWQLADQAMEAILQALRG